MNLKYFKSEEFDCPTLEGSGELMDENFVKTLNSIRHSSGVVMVINSGYRSEEHNESVNGKKSSSHLKGLAADVACDNSIDRVKIIEAAILHKVRRIGIAETFIHLDTDSSKPNAIWLY